MIRGRRNSKEGDWRLNTGEWRVDDVIAGFYSPKKHYASFKYNHQSANPCEAHRVQPCRSSGRGRDRFPRGPDGDGR